MKRVLLSLLATLLVVQTAVAAVCRHCEHAMSEDHVHAVADVMAADAHAADTTPDAAPKLDNMAPDGMTDAEPCAVCHLGSASMPMQPVVRDPPAPAFAAPASRSSLYNPSHIERIQRVPLVSPVSC